MTAFRLAAAGLVGAAAVTMVSPASAQTARPPAPAAAPLKVEPAALKALVDMSSFLQSLSAFHLTSRTSLDLVTNEDQKIQLDGTATYKVRKPDAFVIDVVSDEWNRRFLYLGREFTLYAPKLGYFSTWAAPATIKEAIEDAETRFGISLPLDDLFRWSEPGQVRLEALDSGYLVGVETVEGVKTDHYAFREGHIDWQIWIQHGSEPLPRKLIIVDRREATQPAYTARLSWVLNPTLTNAEFDAYRPPSDAKRIRINLQQPGAAP